MTDEDRIEHMRGALERIAKPVAFYVATAHIDPEAFARMIFAQAILDGHTVESAIEKTEYETHQRYPLSKPRQGHPDDADKIRYSQHIVEGRS